MPSLDKLAQQTLTWYYLEYLGEFYDDGDGYDYVTIGSDTFFGNYEASGWIFALNIPQGATISTATLDYKITALSGSYASFDADWYFEDIDNAVMPTDFAEAEDAIGNGTTAKIQENFTGASIGWRTSPDLKTSLQELVDRVSWSSGNNAHLIGKNNNLDYDAQISIAGIECDSADHAELSVTYLADEVHFTGEITITMTADGLVKNTGEMTSIIPLTLEADAESNTIGWSTFSIDIGIDSTALNDPTREGVADLDDIVITLDGMGDANVKGTADLPIAIGLTSVAESLRRGAMQGYVPITMDSTGEVDIEGSATITLADIGLYAISKTAEGSADFNIDIGFTGGIGHKYTAQASGEVIVSTNAVALHDIFASLTVELDSVILLVTHSLPPIPDFPESPLLDSNHNVIVGDKPHGTSVIH